MIKCACGCGREFPELDNRNRPRKFISGHNGKLRLLDPAKRETIICKWCGKSFESLKVWHRSFCSLACKSRYIGKGFRGNQSSKFKNGYYIGKNGYIYETVFNHPLSDVRGRLLQHRRIVFDYLGYLPQDCIIHHLNGDKLDNRLENLAIWFQGDHLKEHDPLKSRYHKKTQFADTNRKPIPVLVYPSANRISL